jgi:ribonucleotide reductase beta subunit family protein with ferritin-like domain
MSRIDNILVPNPNRFTLLPIKHYDLWRFYKVSFDTFWGPAELKLDTDLVDWETKLTETEKSYIKHILAFFANADGIVNENILERFQKDVQYIEASYFYTYQAMIENVHSEVYAILIDTYIKDENEKSQLFNAIETIPCIKKKSDWALKWIESKEASFGERLLAFAAIEGIFFSGAFAGIFWLRKRNLLPGLAQVNTLIARDEGLHQQFACHLYKNHLNHQKASPEKARQIIMEACELEKEFQTVALPVSMIGMNNQQMCTYIEYVSDYLMVMIGEPKIYNVENPFDFMELISLETLESMFEVKGVNYSHGNIPKGTLNFDTVDDDDF